MTENNLSKEDKSFKRLTVEQLNEMTQEQRAVYFKEADLHKLPKPEKPALSKTKAAIEYLLRNGMEQGTKTGGILMPFSKPNKGC